MRALIACEESQRVCIAFRERGWEAFKRTHGIWLAKFDGRQLAWNDPVTAKLRSQTPRGVAKAMAEQWGGYLEELYV